MSKRWIVLALLITMLLTLLACGQSATEAPAEEPATKLTEEELAMEIDFPNVPETLAAKMEIDIYLLAGQSNASGATQIEKAPAEVRDHNTYENVRYFFECIEPSGTPRYYSRDYCAVHEGLGYDDGPLVNDIPADELSAGPTPYIGPELGMARVLNDRYATNERKALIIKVAAGGTLLLANEEAGQGNISNTGWNSFLTFGSWYPQALQTSGNADPSRPTGYLTRQLCATAKSVFDDLVNRGFAPENIHFKALCWMQGESDRNNSRKYAEAFPLFAEEVRASLAENISAEYSTLPIVIGEISETTSSASPDSIKTNQKFNDTLHKLAENDAAITVIPTAQFHTNEIIDGVNTAVGTDSYHWNYVDMLQIGELFGATAFEVSH